MKIIPRRWVDDLLHPGSTVVLFDRMPRKILLTFSIIALTFMIFTPSAASTAAGPAWLELVDGIAYREFYLDTPNRVYVARLERGNPDVYIESSIGFGTLSGRAETVRDQAARYDDAIAYWGHEWGTRMKVVAAINGAFFDTQTGVPWSGQVHSGWYARRFEDRHSSSGFAWTLDRQAFIGGCVVSPPGKQTAYLPDGSEVRISGLNVPRPESGLMIYTPQWDVRTPGLKVGERVVEALVELKSPLTLTPTPARVEGRVLAVRLDEGSLPIPFDGIVLSATGKPYGDIKKLRPGDTVGISQELRHLQPDCRTPNPDSWTNTYASVAGSYIFLRAGMIQPQADLGAVLHNPRTAVALNTRFVYFIVVDGRNRLESRGMSMADLAAFARSRLGAVDGVALDGGGSSTMVINGEVMNFPNSELAEPSSQAEPGPAAGVGPGGKVERVVANGLLMVAALPRQVSNRFEAGQRVIIQDQSEVNLRLGPGTNFGILTALPVGSVGTIVEHPLNGILAKGLHWWKVEIGEITGWVNQNSLERAP